MHLHLVRHAPPLIDRDALASSWPLDPNRQATVAPLASSGVLPAGATWFSSLEPKAMATADLLRAGADVEHVAELGEAARPACWTERAEFDAMVARSFARPGESVAPGWETVDAVRIRLLQAVDDRVLPLAAGHGHLDAVDVVDVVDVVLVGHGTAWTVLVAALTGAAPDLDTWRAMTMPDHCQLDIAAGRSSSPAPGCPRARVVRHWGDWRSHAGGVPA